MSPPLLRFAQDSSPVACGAPRAASLRCRPVKRSTIPPRTPANERSDVGAALEQAPPRAAFLKKDLFSWSKLGGTWLTKPLISLREQQYTEHFFFKRRKKKVFKYCNVLYLFYRRLLFTSRRCFLISVVPKERPCLMNSRRQENNSLIVRQETKHPMFSLSFWWQRRR